MVSMTMMMQVPSSALALVAFVVAALTPGTVHGFNVVPLVVAPKGVSSLPLALPLSRPPSSQTSLCMASSSSTASERNQKVQELLKMARQHGPIGSFADEQIQKDILELAKSLKEYSDPNPSEAPYRGVHNLVYSDSGAASSGKLFGPVYGSVTQTFLDDNQTFINTVQIGPLQLSLRAERTKVNDMTNTVTFKETMAKAFGQTIVNKEINGGGTWNYIFHGNVQDADGTEKLVRVMLAPSLFVIEQPVN